MGVLDPVRFELRYGEISKDMEYLFSFEKLKAYVKARKLVVEVYKLLQKFPETEKYALCDQVRRSIVSVPSNIAEQSGKCSKKEKIHFIEIACGSLMESYCQLQIAADLGYLENEDLNNVKPYFFEISRLLSGLKNSLKES